MTCLYTYADVPTIKRFASSDAFVRGLMGPYGGGKSSGCAWEIPLRGVRQAPGPDGRRRSRWVVIRNSFRQLEDSTIKTFLQWFPPYRFGDWKPSNHNYTFKSFRAADNEPSAEIEVFFRALDRPDQLGNLLSTEYTGAWINEGRDVPWSIWEAVMGRVGRYPAIRDGGPSWFGVFSDTNPPDTDSDWYRFFEERDLSEDIDALNEAMTKRGVPFKPYTVDTYRMCFKQPSGMGPDAENIANLPPAYYERQAVGKSKDWIKVYLHGEYGFTVDGKPVFPEYSDAIHCPEEKRLWPKLNPDLPIIRSYDFGLTPACVFGQVQPDGRWFVTDEMTSHDMGFDQFSDEVLEYCARHMRGCDFEDYGDPAGAQRSQTDTKTCFQIGHSKGIMLQPAPQTLRLRLEGTRKPLRTLVSGKPQFQLHPRCKRLRKALLGGYHYRRLKVSGDRYTEEPDKGPLSHVADALTYQGAVLFGPTLRQIEMPGGHSSQRIDDRTRSGVTGY